MKTCDRVKKHFPVVLAFAGSPNCDFQAQVGSSALHVAVAPATYLNSDTRFCRYSATATFIDKAFRFYLIVLNII